MKSKISNKIVSIKNRLLNIFPVDEKGQGALIILGIVAVAIGLAFIMQTKTSSPPAAVNEEPCYRIDTTRKVEYNVSENIPLIANYPGTPPGYLLNQSTKDLYFDNINKPGTRKYVKIRGLSSLVTEEIQWHIVKGEKQINGHDVYILLNAFDGLCKGNPSKENQESFCSNDNTKKTIASTNFVKKKRDANGSFLGTYDNDNDAFKLLFIDYTDKMPYKREGFIFAEIYLLDESPEPIVPTFVKEFCEDGQPVNPITIFPNEKGEYLPPFTVKKTDITGISSEEKLNSAYPNGNEVYKLFVYERLDSYVGEKTHSSADSQFGIVESSGHTYTAHLVTYAALLSLVDRDNNMVYLYSKSISAPNLNQTAFPTHYTLQLHNFPNAILDPWGWWSPECKPAIYLYPEEKTDINVKVKPAGFLTYTDPVYPINGWDTIAYPGGKLEINGKNYDYLYYESKIKDSEINKPKEGFVVPYYDLPVFYNSILPKLGLVENETVDFKEYWEKVLPYSPYYFIGLMAEKDIEKIEPLTFSKKPSTIIRVRFYFEALNNLMAVKAPTIITPIRKGFTVVEWGGLVKVDKNHPFTCSQ